MNINISDKERIEEFCKVVKDYINQVKEKKKKVYNFAEIINHTNKFENLKDIPKSTCYRYIKNMRK